MLGLIVAAVAAAAVVAAAVVPVPVAVPVGVAVGVAVPVGINWTPNGRDKIGLSRSGDFLKLIWSSRRLQTLFPP